MRGKILFFILPPVMLAALFAFDIYADDIIVINSEQSPSLLTENTASKGWSILDKLRADDQKLENLDLFVGKKDVTFYEMRGGIVKSRVKLKSFPRSIGLELLNLKSGETSVVKITQSGDIIVSPAGYEIEAATRPSGIRINAWATEYKVRSPADMVVLRVMFPISREEIRKRKVKSKKTGKYYYEYYNVVVSTEKFLYAPHSPDTHFPEIIREGGRYTRQIVDEAFDYLKQHGVRSHAFPDMLVADLPYLKKDYYFRRPLLEHTDYYEFTLDPKYSIERTLYLLGANAPGVAFSRTGSSKGAYGWVQYTSKTYKSMRSAYPAAKLEPNFEKGASDHLNSMIAAILLDDNNLAFLIKKYGKSMADDPRLEEYLASLYNASPKSVTKSLTASIGGKLATDDWTGKLLEETKGYVAKLRYLQNNF